MARGPKPKPSPDKKSLTTQAKRKTLPKTPTVTVSAWEDDPGDGVLRNVSAPDISKQPLAFMFPKPAPAPAIYSKGTLEFRYWAAAEALRRGADFWASRIPLAKWQVGQTLKVILDEGPDLNAYYDRKALNFFHGPSPEGIVYSGESPDIVCHEMGHAILDSFKPELWDAGSQEAAAFHEAFADISAILSAIQVPSLRADILNQVGGTLYQSTRLSRLAEQLGAAIRAQQPDAVDRDCLRNAVNSFTYQNPSSLPSSSPASQLSSEPHSFSRVFTGAFFESLGAILTAKAADPKAPTDAEFIAAADDLAHILIQGLKAAPVVSNWYAQVAASMALVAQSVNPSYPAILKAIFVRRAILSLHSAASVESIQQAPMAMVPTAPTESGVLPTIALHSSHLGIKGVILVEAPAQARQFLAMSAAADSTPIDPASAATSAQNFLDDLFQRGRVDYGDAVKDTAPLDHGGTLKSHKLVKVAGGAKLQRILFDCGCSVSR